MLLYLCDSNIFKYVPYLANPPAPLSDDDRKRYNVQLDCVRKVLAVFSDPNFSESNPTMKASVTTAMNEVSATSSPLIFA